MKLEKSEERGDLLVTGGAGFIGSALVQQLMTEDDGAVVIDVDSLTHAGNLESLESVSSSPRYHFERVDICDAKSIRELFERYNPDRVIPLASETQVDRSIDGPAAFIQTNIIRTYTLLERARKYWTNLCGSVKERFRFLHVSTDEVFGSLGPTGHFSETSPYSPNSPYASSKAAADHLVRAWRISYDLAVLLTNYSNNFGPLQVPEKLIPLMILTALEERALPHIRRWSKRPRLALRGGSLRGHPETTYCGQSRRGLLIKFVKDRAGHDHRYAVNPSKITEGLGWTAVRVSNPSYYQTVQWYLANLSWCGRVMDCTYHGESLWVSS